MLSHKPLNPYDSFPLIPLVVPLVIYVYLVSLSGIALNVAYLNALIGTAGISFQFETFCGVLPLEILNFYNLRFH